MATIQFPSLSSTAHKRRSLHQLFGGGAKQKVSALLPTSTRRHRRCIVRSYKVVIEHDGERKELEVGADESILESALETGMTVPHDCKLGVCMTCPARLVSGSVDQSDGMLSDDVIAGGYALLCVAYPRSDCHIRTIPEEELLSLQLATAND